MATLRSVEREIQRLEGITVRFRYRDGRDVRSDRRDIPSYRYKRALPGSKTVAAWRAGRFADRYPGFEVEVVDVNGRTAHGRTLLSTLRAQER